MFGLLGSMAARDGLPPNGPMLAIAPSGRRQKDKVAHRKKNRVVVRISSGPTPGTFKVKLNEQKGPEIADCALQQENEVGMAPSL